MSKFNFTKYPTFCIDGLQGTSSDIARYVAEQIVGKEGGFWSKIKGQFHECFTEKKGTETWKTYHSKKKYDNEEIFSYQGACVSYILTKDENNDDESLVVNIFGDEMMFTMCFTKNVMMNTWDANKNEITCRFVRTL